MLLERMTDAYTPLESWIYDRWLAPATAAFSETVFAELDAALPRGGALLDVGCGGGQLALLVAGRRPDARVRGLDLSPEQIRRATARARAAGAAVDFRQGSALALPFPDGSFDTLVSVASIKHWPDQARGLAECVRVLRPGGQLAVAEVDRGCRLEDVHTFIDHLPIPRPARWAFVPVFRTWVAGRAIDLDDARALLAGLGLDEASAARVPGMPAVVLRGRKRRG